MSNRENLRRIAALSLVIAFGMSGAAGLANEQETGEIVTQAAQSVYIGYTPSTLDVVDAKLHQYSKDITISAEEKSATFNLAKEWEFIVLSETGDKELATTVTLNGAKIDETNDSYALTFAGAGTYTVVISADGVEDTITITFNVTKDQKPEEEKQLTVSYDDLKPGALFEKTVDPNTFKYSDNLKLDNGTATAEFAKFWTFKLGNDKITDFELPAELTLADADFNLYSAKFTEAGTYTLDIKAKGSDSSVYETPTVKLVFNVLPEGKPATPVYSKLDINEEAIGNFSKDAESENTYKYTGEFKADDEGNYTADFSSFWKFFVGENEVASAIDSDGITKNVEGTYTFTPKGFGEHKVTFYAKEHNDPENDAMLTLIFKVDEPKEVVPVVDINRNVRESYFDEGKDEYTYNYSSEYYDSLANPYTVDFKEFWTFTNPDAGDRLGYIITDNDGKVIKPIDNEKPGATNEYAVTFPKTGKYTLVVKALKADGTAYDAPVITLNFDIKSDVPELTIHDEKADGFTIDDTTCTYKLTLDEADTAKDVEFTKFWQFDLNGKDLNVKDLEFDLPKDIKYTGAGYKVSFDKAGEYTYEIKAIKPAAEGETEAVIYDAPVLTLKFIVTKAEPEIKHSELDVSDSHEGFELGAGFKVPTYLYATELVPDEDGTCTATFQKFWNFKVDGEAITDEEYSYNDDDEIKIEASEEGYTVTLTNVEPGLHSVNVHAKGYTTEEDGVITLVFSVAEAEPEIENAELVIDEGKLGNFKAVESATNTYAYPELTLSEDGSYTVEYDHFWSFIIKGTETSIDSEDIVISEGDGISVKCENEKCTFTFSKASGENPFEVKIYAQKDADTVYNGEGDDFLTLNFTVKPAPEKTKEPDYPYYPPVDPVTPAPTATPTATPAPTETPAPTDAPTDAPTSAPTAAPDVEMQVSAGGKRLNVRSGAGIGNSIIARLNDGSKVTVLLVEGDWSYIRATVNGNVIEGYVSSQYLKEISTVEPTEPANARVSTNGSALRLRSRASLNASIIARMPNGSSLKVLETVNGWCRVQFTAANGTVHEGWASSQYITVIA